jgi:predicted nucleotidyltransferase
MEAESVVIARLVRRIVEMVHPLRVILFGSAARGQRGPDGDIDFLRVRCCEDESPDDNQKTYGWSFLRNHTTL